MSTGEDYLKDQTEEPVTENIAQSEGEDSERPSLPDGYRVVAVASDAWVLVDPRGAWVASYRGELDLWRASLDANSHRQN